MYVCPNCKTDLKRDNSKFLKCVNRSCNLQKKIFPIINEKPILIPFRNEDCILEDSFSSSFTNLGSQNRDKSSRKMVIKKRLRNLIYGKNTQTIKNYKYLSKQLKNNSKVLIIGGGTIGSGSEYFYSSCKNKSIQIDSIDIFLSENITAIADAHYLPFKNESYDFVIIQAVLEHVVNPYRVVEELHRILVNKGIVYSEVPFMQSVHEGPYDFLRFSHSGHRWLFKKFIEISSGAHHGAFSSVLFIFSHSISGLTRNKAIGIIIRVLFCRFSKFLDYLVGNKSNIDIACGTYFLGFKSNDLDKNNILDLKNYYKGAQR